MTGTQTTLPAAPEKSTAEIRASANGNGGPRICREISAMRRLAGKLGLGARAAVLLTLLDRGDSQTGAAYPTAESIASECEVGRRNVQRALADLTKLGVVELVNAGGGRGRSAVRRTRAEDYLNSLNTGAGNSVLENSVLENTDSNGHKTPARMTQTPAHMSLNTGARATPIAHEQPNQQPIEPSKRGKAANGVHLPAIPASLNTPEFKTTWDAFQAHRREKRSRITPTSAKRMFADFEEHGVTVAVAAMEESMRRGWIGCFPDKINGKRAGEFAEPEPGLPVLNGGNGFERREISEQELTEILPEK